MLFKNTVFFVFTKFLRSHIN